jgi:hypothetical protein
MSGQGATCSSLPRPPCLADCRRFGPNERTNASSSTLIFVACINRCCIRRTQQEVNYILPQPSLLATQNKEASNFYDRQSQITMLPSRYTTPLACSLALLLFFNPMGHSFAPSAALRTTTNIRSFFPTTQLAAARGGLADPAEQGEDVSRQSSSRSNSCR